MDLKTFLEQHPMINQAQLAKELWKSVKYPNTKLANKLAKTAGQRITPADAKNVQKVLDELAESIRTNRIEP